jgi:pilus assembly protein CpaE
MFPLEVVVVGVRDDVLPHLRRELSNLAVRVVGEFSDAGEAIAAFGLSNQEMRMFIQYVHGPEGMEQLKRLARTYASRPVLALMDGTNDVSTVTAAMRAGALQIVTLPLSAEDLRAAMDCLALHFAYSGETSRVIAVAGVTGGSGATTLAINLAHEIAAQHRRHTILAELSLQMGMLAPYLDVSPKFTTHDLLAEMERVDVYVVQQVLTKVAENFDVLAGPHSDIERLQISAQDVIRLVEYTKQLADVVVLDVPCTLDSLYFETLAAANQIVLVGEQKIPSVRNLQMVRSTLQRDYSVKMQYVVINRYDSRIQEFSEKQLSQILNVPKLVTIANDYASVISAVNHGRLLRLEAPNSRVVRDIAALARLLLNVEGKAPVAGEKDGMSLFGRLMHPFRGAAKPSPAAPETP